MKLETVVAVRPDKTVYRDGENIIKVFSPDKRKSDVLNEALNQARVEETGINIPKIKDVTCLEDGRWAIVMDYIPGKTLAAMMEEHPENIDEYLEKFVDIQLKMHAQKVPLLNKLKDKMSRKISETGLNATIRYELNVRLESMPKHTKLCHGDYNPSNVIIRDDGEAFDIDWAHATQGAPEADGDMTYLLFSLTSKEQAEAYLDVYCERADMPKQIVRQWLPVIAASELARGRKVDEEFLMSWIDVFDYQ